MKGSVWTKLLKCAALLLVATYIVYQLYASVYNPLVTETATHYDGYDGFTVEGLIARNEKIIDYDTSLVKYYVIGDGQKVSKGGVIAELYNDSNQISINNQIKELQKNIENIEDTMAYNSTEAVDLNLLSNKVYDALSSYILSCESGAYKASTEKGAELLSAISIRQAATGETVDFSASLDLLNSRLTKLQSMQIAGQGSIRAESSGYFVSQVDGYETVINSDSLEDITPEKLAQIKPVEVKPSQIGKIVEDYNWYIISEINIDKSARFSVGKDVMLKTSLPEMPELKATVTAVNKAKTGNKAVLVLQCDSMNAYISSARNISVTVVTENYDGLMVNRKALRVVDGELGVYVISGMQAMFVKVEVLKYTEDYAICKEQSIDSNILRLYDKVIVKGKNLYDGKIVN